MDSRSPNIALEVALVKFDNFDHDFHSIIALILYDLALSALGILNSKSAILHCAGVYHNDCKCHLVFFKKNLLFTMKQLPSSSVTRLGAPKLRQILKIFYLSFGPAILVTDELGS